MGLLGAKSRTGKIPSWLPQAWKRLGEWNRLERSDRVRRFSVLPSSTVISESLEHQDTDGDT